MNKLIITDNIRFKLYKLYPGGNGDEVSDDVDEWIDTLSDEEVKKMLKL